MDKTWFVPRIASQVGLQFLATPLELSMAVNLEEIWKSCNFNPDVNKKKAIYHVEGLLFLATGLGPGIFC